MFDWMSGTDHSTIWAIIGILAALWVLFWGGGRVMEYFTQHPLTGLVSGRQSGWSSEQHKLYALGSLAVALIAVIFYLIFR